MIPVLVGQIIGLAFACGLNLYAAVGSIGLLARFGIIQDLPAGLQGLRGGIVIGSAIVLYAIEAVIDKVRHADSLWDTVHTFVRPPAAALLAVGALWTQPLTVRIGGALFAFLVALSAHGIKAGFRLALNAAQDQRGHAWVSVAEDVAAVAFAVAALKYPSTALAAGAAVLVLVAVFGPRFWRAFALGIRCLAAGFRALFTRSRWRGADDLPRTLRTLLGDTPVGRAPPRTARASVLGLPGTGAYRNGWLAATRDGPVFLYRALTGPRSTPLPATTATAVEPGLWADLIHITFDRGRYTIYLLKDGPPADLVLVELGEDRASP